MRALLVTWYSSVSKSDDIYQGYNAKQEQLNAFRWEGTLLQLKHHLTEQTDFLRSTLICHACFDQFDGVLLDYLLLWQSKTLV